MSDVTQGQDAPYRLAGPEAMDQWRQGTPASPLAQQSPLAAGGQPPQPPTPTAGPPPQYSINRPPMPQMGAQQAPPPPPDAKEFQKDAMGWASAFAVLGAIAGRFTRAPGGAALGAFGAAVKGWQTGNLQAYDTATKQWEEQNKVALENNQRVIDDYKRTLDNYKLNIDEQMQEIQLKAANYHDKIAYDLAQSKNYTAFAQLHEKNVEFTQKARQFSAALQQKIDSDNEKREERATYWLSPEGQAKFQTLPETAKAGVKQLIDMAAAKGAGRSSVAQDRQQWIEERTAETGERPTADQIEEHEAERSGKIAEGGAVGRRAGGIALAVQEAHDTVPNVLAAAEQSAGKGLATWNQIENRWNVQKGDANYAYYVQQLNSLINVYGRVISGGGKGTVSDLEHAREMLNPNMPLSAVKGSIRGFTTEIDIAEKAPEKVRARMRGGKETPAQTTGAPVAPAGGETATDPTKMSDDDLKKKLGL